MKLKKKTLYIIGSIGLKSLSKYSRDGGQVVINYYVLLLRVSSRTHFIWNCCCNAAPHFLFIHIKTRHTHTRTGFFVCVHEILHPSYIRGRGGGIEHYSSCHSSSCCCCSCVYNNVWMLGDIHRDCVAGHHQKTFSPLYIIIIITFRRRRKEKGASIYTWSESSSS